jgi:two-component system OmpR family response regulator
MHILLLGDYRPLLKPLKLGLEEEGFTVDVSSVGDVDPAQLAGASYDALVLDLAGSRDAGRSLLKQWRQAGLGLPVLLLTVPDAVDPAADDWLVKPFSLETLLAKLRDLAPTRCEVDRVCMPGNCSSGCRNSAGKSF